MKYLNFPTELHFLALFLNFPSPFVSCLWSGAPGYHLLGCGEPFSWRMCNCYPNFPSPLAVPCYPNETLWITLQVGVCFYFHWNFEHPLREMAECQTRWLLGRVEMVVLLLQQENAFEIELHWRKVWERKSCIQYKMRFPRRKDSLLTDSLCHPRRT